MSVWFAIPSKRPAAEAELILGEWRGMGYNVIVQRDEDERPAGDRPFIARLIDKQVDWTIFRPYKGYAEAVNHLVRLILANDPEAEWIVTGGDDVQPDFNKTASLIAAECNKHFGVPGPFGVMQPTGDRWGDHRNATHTFVKWPDQPNRCISCGQAEDTPPHSVGAYIDRVCGSPWLGRLWCETINGGAGPLWSGNRQWPGYFHMGVDEELQLVAQRYGVLWQRPDLIHLHKHWGRQFPGKPIPATDARPAFLERANSDAEWNRYKKLLDERKAAGFPGSEPL